MPEDPENTRCDGRLPDELWERMVPLLPPRKPHPWGCHRPRVRSTGDGRHLLRAPHGLPGERAAGDRDLLQQFRPAPLPRVDGGGRLPGAVGEWPDGLRCLQGDCLAMARDGWRHDHSPPWGGTRWARIPPIAGRAGPSAASSPRAAASPSASQGRGPIGTTSRWCGRRARGCPSSGRHRPRPGPQGGAWTRARPTPRCASCGPSAGSRPTSARGGKRPKR
jgi:hypothetical protein